MWTFLLVLAVALVSFVGGVCAVLAWIVPRAERYLIFKPSRFVMKTPADVDVPFDQVFIDTPDGCRLSAWHLRPEEPRGSIVYFDGNNGNLGVLTEILVMLYRQGYQVLGVDYRGYGWSTGEPSEEGLYQDAVSSVRYFRRHLHRDGSPLIYWGRSLGSCVASFAAREATPDGLVLESAFPSVDSMMRYAPPHFRAFRIFSRIRLATESHLREHDYPILMIHGDQDKTIPLEQGVELYEKTPDPKEFYCVEEAGHVDLHMVDTDAYLERIGRFIDRLSLMDAEVEAEVVH